MHRFGPHRCATSLATALALGATAWLNQATPGLGAQSDKGQVGQVLTTNRVVSTNLVLTTVTNYVVTTNTLIITNGARPTVSKSLPPLDWVPPADDFDWVQLKSGEWLKGRIKAMQNRKLEFDSEEMDDQTFDWKDIRQLRSKHIYDVVFEDRETVSGPIVVTPEKVIVGGAEPRSFRRDDLQGITPGGSKEASYWSGEVVVGLTLRAGNTEQVEYNARANLQRRTPGTRFSLDYLGNVSSLDGVESANNHRVNSEFDWWLSRRLYLVTPFAEYYKDPFQNLERRITVGAGVGYDLIVNDKVEWDLMVGPAYQQNWFESVQPGEETTKSALALAIGTKFDWEINRRIDLILEYRGQYSRREVGETTHHGVATLEFELTKRLDLDISIVWDRINNPKIGADGVEPKQDDFRLVLGLGIDF